MDSLQELVEGKYAVARHHDLAVEHEALRADAADGVDDFREIACQRLSGFRLQIDLVTVPENEAAKAVPLRLVLPLRPGGNCLHRLGFHGHEGLVERKHTSLTQTAGISPAVQVD